MTTSRLVKRFYFPGPDQTDAPARAAALACTLLTHTEETQARYAPFTTQLPCVVLDSPNEIQVVPEPTTHGAVDAAQDQILVNRLPSTVIIEPEMSQALAMVTNTLADALTSISLTPGATGPEGAPGGTGVTGPTGVAGPVGPTGATGPGGAAGADGAAGPPGSVGPTGATGPAGGTGAPGAVGATGPAGGVGATGPVGVTGPVGPVGATGPQGTAGTVGATGPQGVAGAPGSVGSTGPTGPVGATGPAGGAGPAGATGPAGGAGAVGATGPIGATGPQGTAGTVGATGPAGADGGVGATGPAGTAPGGVIRKTGSQTMTATAQTAITDANFSVVANSKYFFLMNVNVTTSTGTSPTTAYGFTGPAGATVAIAGEQDTSTSVEANVLLTAFGNAAAGAQVANTGARFTGVVETGGTAGTVQLTAARGGTTPSMVIPIGGVQGFWLKVA